MNCFYFHKVIFVAFCGASKGDNGYNANGDIMEVGYLASEGEKLVPASQHGRGQAADLSSRLVHRDL